MGTPVFTGTGTGAGTGAGTGTGDPAADAAARLELIRANALMVATYVKVLADLYGSTGWSCLRGAAILDYDGDTAVDIVLIHPGGFYLVISGDVTTGHRILLNNYPGAPPVGPRPHSWCGATS